MSSQPEAGNPLSMDLGNICASDGRSQRSPQRAAASWAPASRRAAGPCVPRITAFTCDWGYISHVILRIAESRLLRVPFP
jgi:hypothetical protein